MPLLLVPEELPHPASQTSSFQFTCLSNRGPSLERASGYFWTDKVYLRTSEVLPNSNDSAEPASEIRQQLQIPDAAGPIKAPVLPL